MVYAIRYSNVLHSCILLHKSLHIRVGRMNQNMHSWIAMLLVLITIIFLKRDAFLEIEGKHSYIIISIQIFMYTIFFGIWLYRIS